MAEATLSSKNQIVIPRDARRALNIKPGDRLSVVVRGDRVIVLQSPKSHHAAIRGLARGVYSGMYVKKERRSSRRHRRIAMDTSVSIYQLEASTRYLPLTDYIFSWLERPDSKAVTSTITMTALLVQPYRDDPDEQRVEDRMPCSTHQRGARGARAMRLPVPWCHVPRGVPRYRASGRRLDRRLPPRCA